LDIGAEVATLLPPFISILETRKDCDLASNRMVLLTGLATGAATGLLETVPFCAVRVALKACASMCGASALARGRSNEVRNSCGGDFRTLIGCAPSNLDRSRLKLASITVATAKEIEQLFLSYEAAGVAFRQALRSEPWGAKTFIVTDPDENLILFAGPDTE
jgi:hypothetical protein